MLSAKTAVCGVYGLVTVVWALDVHLYGEQAAPPSRGSKPIERAQSRGQVDGLPRLDPEDGMANAAILNRLLAEVPAPALGPGGNDAPDGDDEDRPTCRARARAFAVRIDGRASWVRFGARAVCQLDLLKRISVAQGAAGRSLGEIAAFVLGRRLGGSRYVDVSRVVVPPFRFTDASVDFVPADLGPLEKGEHFIGTWHTHPGQDLDQGVLSIVDLRFLRGGTVDFHGSVGSLARRGDGVDWLFDIVEPRDGGWNIYAHDDDRLEALWKTCLTTPSCPLDDLRVAGSQFHLQTRAYEVESGVSSDVFGN